MPTYYTYAKDVSLLPGQTLGFTTGKGYYAAGTPTTASLSSRSTDTIGGVSPTRAAQIAVNAGVNAGRTSVQPVAASSCPGSNTVGGVSAAQAAQIAASAGVNAGRNSVQPVSANTVGGVSPSQAAQIASNAGVSAGRSVPQPATSPSATDNTLGGASPARAAQIAGSYGLTPRATSVQPVPAPTTPLGASDSIGGVTPSRAVQIGATYGLTAGRASTQPLPAPTTPGGAKNTIGGVSAAQAVEIAAGFGIGDWPGSIQPRRGATIPLGGRNTLGGVSPGRAVQIAGSYGMVSSPASLHPTPAKPLHHPPRSPITKVGSTPRVTQRLNLGRIPAAGSSKPLVRKRHTSLATLFAGRVKPALDLSVETRLSTMETFFRRYPGAVLYAGNYWGYGQGALEFFAWEQRSGRTSASPDAAWWKVVNGFLVQDLGTAMQDIAARRTGQTAAVQAWIDYAMASERGDATQEMFWTAHQLSLHEGVALASGYASTSPVVNEFREWVVIAVDLAAVGNEDTAGPGIAYETEFGYPSTLAVSQSTVSNLQGSLRTAMILGDLPTRVPANQVGFGSSRWRWDAP